MSRIITITGSPEEISILAKFITEFGFVMNDSDRARLLDIDKYSLMVIVIYFPIKAIGIYEGHRDSCVYGSDTHFFLPQDIEKVEISLKNHLKG